MLDLDETNPQVRLAVATADSAESIAAAYEITDAVMYADAGDELRKIVTRKTEIEAVRVDLKKPILEAGRKIDALFKTPTERLERAEQSLRGKMVAYNQAEQQRQRQAEAEARRAADEAGRKAREEAEAQAAALRRLADEAAKAGDVEKAAEAAAEAQDVVMFAETQIEAITSNAIQRAATKAPIAAGVGMRQNWKADVTDLPALIRAAVENPAAFAMYLLANDQALTATAKSTKGAVAIPGVRIYDAGGLSVQRT